MTLLPTNVYCDTAMRQLDSYGVMVMTLAIVLAWAVKDKCATAQEQYFRLHTSSGSSENARLEDLSEPLKFSFRSEGTSRVLTASEVVRWGAWQPPQNCSVLWLADGSWIVGRLEFDAKVATIYENDWLNTIRIPLALCRGVVVSAPVRAMDWSRLQSQMTSAQGDKDSIWMEDGRKMNGILSILPGPANRDTEQASAAVFALESSGKKTELVLDDEVQAIVFSPALQPPILRGPAAAAIALRDGSLLNVRRMSRNPLGKLRLQLELPIEIESLDDSARFATAVDYIIGSPSKTAWVSDFAPTLYRYLGSSSLKWDLGRDRDLYGRPLVFADGFVAKGLSMHSPSQAAYRWDGSAGKFLAEIVMAPPPEATSQDLGSVLCKVILVRDGKLVEAFTSRPIHARTPPQAVEVDITGAQTVVINTDQADIGPLGDHVIWLDARMVDLSPTAADKAP